MCSGGNSRACSRHGAAAYFIEYILYKKIYNKRYKINYIYLLTSFLNAEVPLLSKNYVVEDVVSLLSYFLIFFDIDMTNVFDQRRIVLRRLSVPNVTSFFSLNQPSAQIVGVL